VASIGSVRNAVSTIHEDGQRRSIAASASGFGIITLDIRGCIRSWDAGAESILAYRPSEIIGEHCSLLFTAEDRKEGWPAYELRWASGVGCAEHTRWHRRRGGAYVAVASVLTAIRDDRTRLLGYCKVILPAREPRVPLRSMPGYPDLDVIHRRLLMDDAARRRQRVPSRGLLRRFLGALSPGAR
jgi:PAS domain S-box-containing protein